MTVAWNEEVKHSAMHVCNRAALEKWLFYYVVVYPKRCHINKGTHHTVTLPSLPNSFNTSLKTHPKFCGDTIHFVNPTLNVCAIVTHHLYSSGHG